MKTYTISIIEIELMPGVRIFDALKESIVLAKRYGCNVLFDFNAFQFNIHRDSILLSELNRYNFHVY